MPEGDSVRRAARRLHDAMAGQLLTTADLRTPSLATAGSRLVGHRTIEVASYGKHLLHRIDGGWTVHSHLRMDGRWTLVAADRARRVIAAGTARDRIRAVLATSEVSAIGERLGVVELLRTEHEHRVLDRLGPDILGDHFDSAATAAVVAADPRPVAQALLDQRLVAGLGTLYVSESLAETGLWPWTRVADPELVEAALLAARRAMVASLAPGGRRQRPVVFDQVGRGCSRCGATVGRGTVGVAPRVRQLAFCPGCQRAPKG